MLKPPPPSAWLVLGEELAQELHTCLACLALYLLFPYIHALPFLMPYALCPLLAALYATPALPFALAMPYLICRHALPCPCPCLLHTCFGLHLHLPTPHHTTTCLPGEEGGALPHLLLFGCWLSLPLDWPACLPTMHAHACRQASPGSDRGWAWKQWGSGAGGHQPPVSYLPVHVATTSIPSPPPPLLSTSPTSGRNFWKVEEKEESLNILIPIYYISKTVLFFHVCHHSFRRRRKRKIISRLK